MSLCLETNAQANVLMWSLCYVLYVSVLISSLNMSVLESGLERIEVIDLTGEADADTLSYRY